MRTYNTVFVKDLAEVQLRFKEELKLFNNYPITSYEQIINPDDVKYVIVIEDEKFVLVVTKHSWLEYLNNNKNKNI